MTNRIVSDNQLINFNKVVRASYVPGKTLEIEFDNSTAMVLIGEQAVKMWHALRGEPEIVLAPDNHGLVELQDAIRHA